MTKEICFAQCGICGNGYGFASGEHTGCPYCKTNMGKDAKAKTTMNIYELAIAKSTPEEVAKLVQDMAEETEKYRVAFEAARAFIESRAADPDLNKEMIEKYAAYNEAKASLDNAEGNGSTVNDVREILTLLKPLVEFWDRHFLNNLGLAEEPVRNWYHAHCLKNADLSGDSGSDDE